MLRHAGLSRFGVGACALVLIVGAGSAALSAPASGAVVPSATRVWSVVKSPNRLAPVGFANDLYGVSCASVANCNAVGQYSRRVGIGTLVEHWNGKSWSIVTSPNPVGSVSAHLSGVSCASATSCHAVGYTNPTLGLAGAKPLTERWNGKSWSITASPNPTGKRGSVLTAVSCPTASNCNAVGYSVSGSDDTSAKEQLIEHWNGHSWSISAGPSPAPFSVLTGVSCPSATSCYAVGYDEVAGPIADSLVEHWDGAAWSVMSTPNPAGSPIAELVAVSCPTTTSCSAVGNYLPGNSYKTLAERWDGTSWSVVASPNPGPATAFDYLNGVSCTSPTSCDAVGNHDSYPSSLTRQPVTAHWDGATWSTASSPSSSGDAHLDGVSCPSSTTCDAVGSHLGKTLIERSH